MRINNIEFRQKETPEIVKWFPNTYYGQKEKYLSDGWTEENGFVSKNNSHVHKDCFKNPESCIVVAWIKTDSDEPYLESVGTRLLDLSEQERADFWQVYDKATKQIQAELFF